MFALHVSNRTEFLLRHLAEVLRSDRKKNLFEPEIFLIQSLGIERLVCQHLAQEFQCWGNYQFYLPLKFMLNIAQRLNIDFQTDQFDRHFLVWRIDSLLRDISAPVYMPLATFLSGGQVLLKRYQLAKRLANLFDQYQITRPDMLASWSKGRLATNNSAETWQMALWARLKEAVPGCLHRGEVLQSVANHLARQQNVTGLPQRISVFGIHSMPQAFLHILTVLSQNCDVHVYLLSPCRHYWGDAIHPKKELSGFQSQSLSLEQASNQEPQVPHHPLLSLLGQQGREFLQMILAQVESYSQFASYQEGPSDQQSLLIRVQNDMLHDLVQTIQDTMTFAKDRSVVLNACHSRLRELEVLKDHILHSLYQNGTVALKDIIVMAPDIQVYAALIPAVFHDIQHSIADSNLRQKNDVILVLLEFLHLMTRRFCANEVFDVLSNPRIFPNFGLSQSDLEYLRFWISESGIRWGVSAQHRKDLGLPEYDQASWIAGLERMLMGYACNSQDSCAGIVPFTEIEGGQGSRILGGLCDFISFLEKCREDAGRTCSIQSWGSWLNDALRRLTGNSDDRNILEAQQLLSTLQALPEDVHQHDVDIHVISAWIEQASDEIVSASGFLRGSLTFCSLLPMRSIPFKHICLIGMNTGEFPKDDVHAPFDLLKEQFRLGDRSYRADDRYQFLEALLAARISLYISYIGQSITSNEKIPPSTVVGEFVEFLEKAYARKNLVQYHPLHPFDAQYFSPENQECFSYNKHHCTLAGRLMQASDSKKIWWTDELSYQEMIIDLEDVISFYAHPQRWFLKQRLALQPPTSQESLEDEEIFTADALQNYEIDQQTVSACLKNESAIALHARLLASGHIPQGVPGENLVRTTWREASHFVTRLNRLPYGNLLDDKHFTLDLGKYQLRGTLKGNHENGLVVSRYGDMKCKDIVHAWLLGLISKKLRPETHSVFLLTKDEEFIFSIPENPFPDLEQMLDLFQEGNRAPSYLFPKAALAYVRQRVSKQAKIPPLVVARRILETDLEKGYEADVALLFRGQEEELLGPKFEKICADVVEPIWRAING